MHVPAGIASSTTAAAFHVDHDGILLVVTGNAYVKNTWKTDRSAVLNLNETFITVVKYEGIQFLKRQDTPLCVIRGFVNNWSDKYGGKKYWKFVCEEFTVQFRGVFKLTIAFVKKR